MKRHWKKFAILGLVIAVVVMFCLPGSVFAQTTGEKNAAERALDYLAYTPFSYSGLVAQLEFEGYTPKEAVYGVDRCGADWNEQAALMAEDYLDYMAFSYSGLIAQLEFEGFTHQQAEYGVQATGYYGEEPVPADPSISVTKTADVSEVVLGDTTTITYTYTVKNTGNCRLGGVGVVDDKLGKIGHTAWDVGTGSGFMEEGESVTVTKTEPVTPLTLDPIVNTVTVKSNHHHNYAHGEGTSWVYVDTIDTDTCSVKVVDPTVPVITLIGDETVNLKVGDAYEDAGATALDDVDGDITDSIDIVNPVDTSTAGTYTITYNVSDAEGNKAIEVTRTVIVSEEEEPENGNGDEEPENGNGEPEPEPEEEKVVIRRTHPMTCYQIYVNDDGHFEFVFWWEYANNNWVSIYDMEGNLVYIVDFPHGRPTVTVDLPDGMYTVQTFHEGGKVLQEFVIGK